MDEIKAEKLLEKYRSNTLTDEERALLESWYLNWAVEDDHDLTESEINAELERMRFSNPFLETKPRSIKIWPRIAAAASVLLFLSIGGYFLLNKRATQNQVVQNIHQPIVPGTNQVTLTLANGRRILITKKTQRPNSFSRKYLYPGQFRRSDNLYGKKHN